MKIGNHYYSEIIIKDKQEGLLATITDEDVISEDSVRVEFVKNEDFQIEELADSIANSIEETGLLDKIVEAVGCIISKIK